MAERAYNFAAGPGVYAGAGTQKGAVGNAQLHGCGMSVMEMSHRGSQFAEIHAEAKERLRGC